MRIITPANKYFKIVIVRLDRTIQNLLKRLDSPIKSGNDKHESFMYLLAGVIIQELSEPGLRRETTKAEELL